MSKENVIAFIGHCDRQGPSPDPAMQDAEPAAIVVRAETLGFSFSEDDLKSVLNARICNAESLPRPWGWAAARKFGLVRS